MIYLSRAIGRPVLDRNGESIGTVHDLIVAIGDSYPPVTGLVVKTGRREIFLPWASVAGFDEAGARLRTATIDIGKFRQRPNEILLKQDLLDKQIVDIDGRKVVRVNDLRLDEVEGSVRLVAVDVGASGLLRRLGIEGPFRTVARNLRLPVQEKYIDWEDVDPVESTIAGVRLKVPHKGLAELHPADLADILEQLTPRDRARRPRDPRRRGRRGRDRGDGARRAGRRPGGPRARARRGRPRGDEPGRRGRPRRRPLRREPRGDPRPHGGGRGGRGPRAARLRGGFGGRDHDDRVRRGRRHA